VIINEKAASLLKHGGKQSGKKRRNDKHRYCE